MKFEWDVRDKRWTNKGEAEGGASEGWRQDRPMETELTTVLWCILCILIHARARRLGGEARKLTKGDVHLDLAETFNCWPIQWSRKADPNMAVSGSAVIINDSDDDSADDYNDGLLMIMGHDFSQQKH